VLERFPSQRSWANCENDQWSSVVSITPSNPRVAQSSVDLRVRTDRCAGPPSSPHRRSRLQDRDSHWNTKWVLQEASSEPFLVAREGKFAMRALLVSALAMTLIGCRCFAPPQAVFNECTDEKGFACIDGTAGGRWIDPKPAAFKADPATDEATASSAMRRGVRGFFPTSIPVEVAIAGLRLVLAGGVYRPLPIDASHNGIPRFETMTTHAGSPEPSRVCEAMGREG
jgi:hypothetical protein